MLGCGEAASTHIHTPRLCSSLCGSAGGEKRGSDHPGLSSQRAALMWQQHMCPARLRFLLRHTCKTHFYCLPCGGGSGGAPERSRGMLRRRESEPPPVPGGARLESRGLTVTLGEKKPAQSNHISINQLSSKVNRGLIREQC